jgi:predicted dehydrogenase
MKQEHIFDTDRRIRLGIWGLGRGMASYAVCNALNFDVVAGCDYNRHMREGFLKANPGAFVTDSAKEFLARDFDAVLLATYCPAHADDAIACLAAGKHVLSEVTAFHTMAEGVRLVEAVERTGRIYALAENYPFMQANMWLARKWREGFFGELQYAEYEYVHECRALCYTYIDGTPIQPGNQAHSWRSWQSFHYYCTHSLGPMMYITGLRPTRVVALPATVSLAGYPTSLPDGMGGITPSLINMSNGSVVRNLMGATTNDSHIRRLWGTRASAEIVHDALSVRVGAAGLGRRLEITPAPDALATRAASTGHGGGDFWTLYHFARSILYGEPGPFDIYKACDCTIPGILAYRSSVEDGKAYDVPDFRHPAEREQWRNDGFEEPRFDHRHGMFPMEADASITSRFTLTMRDLTAGATAYRAWRDTRLLSAELADPGQLAAAAEALRERLPLLRASQAAASAIITAYPDSVGGRVLREMRDLSEPDVTGRPDFDEALRLTLAGKDAAKA